MKPIPPVAVMIADTRDRLGLTDEQMWKELGIGRATYFRWKKERWDSSWHQIFNLALKYVELRYHNSRSCTKPSDLWQ